MELCARPRRHMLTLAVYLTRPTRCLCSWALVTVTMRTGPHTASQRRLGWVGSSSLRTKLRRFSLRARDSSWGASAPFRSSPVLLMTEPPSLTLSLQLLRVFARQSTHALPQLPRWVRIPLPLPPNPRKPLTIAALANHSLVPMIPAPRSSTGLAI